MVQTVNIVAQRDLIPGSMITRNWAPYMSTLLVIFIIWLCLLLILLSTPGPW